MASLLINILGGVVSDYGIYIIAIIFFWFVLVAGREIRSLNCNIKKINLKIEKVLKVTDYRINNKSAVEEISNIIENDSTNCLSNFKLQYKKFHRSLLLAKEQKSERYYCTADIEEYISSQQIFHLANIYESSSSILIGLGMLFTLICIVIGTEKIAINANASNVEIHSHWMQMIHEFGTKFISSMVGIATALIYTLFYGQMKHNLETNLNKFCTLMHTKDLLPLKTKAQLLYEIKVVLSTKSLLCPEENPIDNK